MTRRAKFSCLLVVIAFIIVMLVTWDSCRRTRQRKSHPAPFASLPSPSPLPSPQPIPSPNEAEQPTTASIATSVTTGETPTPTPCTYPAPLHDGWNVAAFGGERVGEGCWTVPVGMQAIITAPTVHYDSPETCKDDTPTFPRLPCQIIRDDRTLIFHRCVKQVVDAQVIGEVRLVPDVTCNWEREHYQ